MLRRLRLFLKNPNCLLFGLSKRFRGFPFLSDEQFVKFAYKARTGKKLNLVSPRDFNEKLQWLKLYDRRPEYTDMVDKYKVRSFVAKTIGKEYLIPLLGVWDSFDDINFAQLPNQFVLKCTHDSGSVLICEDKNCFDFRAAKKRFERYLKRNLFYHGREWPYKDVVPGIIAEEYLKDVQTQQLMDYKIFNFNGTPKFIQLDFDRFTDHKRNIYSLEWKLLDFQIKYPSDPSRQFSKPDCLEEMLELAGKLSQGIPHVRTDFYIVNGKIKFGEMTFFHGSGWEEFRPEEWDRKFGDMLTLPSKRI